jgi:hypothetical protein
MICRQFLETLHTKKSVSGTNAGLRRVDGKMVMYMQERIGLGYFFAKRQVLEDGITTKALKI